MRRSGSPLPASTATRAVASFGPGFARAAAGRERPAARGARAGRARLSARAAFARTLRGRAAAAFFTFRVPLVFLPAMVRSFPVRVGAVPRTVARSSSHNNPKRRPGRSRGRRRPESCESTIEIRLSGA